MDSTSRLPRLRWLRKIAASLLVLAQAIPASGAEIYVSAAGGGSGATPDSPTTLQTALASAKANGEPDTVYLQAGQYLTYGSPFSYSAVQSDQVRLLGGWDDGFTSQYRGMDPLLMTSLDGYTQTRVMEVVNSVAAATVTVTVENIAFVNGKATDVHGAGLRLSGTGGGIIEAYIRRCLFKGNRGQITSPATSGGGIFSDSWFEVTDSVFTDNAAFHGGGINISDPTFSLSPVIDRCSFDNNATLNKDGGGSDINNTSSLTIRNSRFFGRAGGVTSFGGAINHTGNNSGTGLLTVINSVISGKKSWYWGAGIHIWNANAKIYNTLFAGNTAGVGTDNWGRGGGIAIYDPDAGSKRTVEVLNCTFAKNRSEGDGDGLYGMAIDNRVETLKVVNSIFWDNGTTSPVNTSAGGTTSVTYSDVEYGHSGAGNINANPAFADFAGNDFHLTEASPCRDAGTESPLGTYLYALYPTSADLDGRVRIQDLPDMGAYELDTGPYANAVGRGDPAVAHDSDLGRFLAVYSHSDGTGGSRVSGRLIAADGEPLSDEFAISEQKGYERILPAVAYDSFHRKFVVVWDAFNASTNDVDILGQLVEPDGSLEGWNFAISALAAVGEWNPAIAYGAQSHQTFVVWEKDDYAADEQHVVGCLLLEGAPQGAGEIAIADITDVDEAQAAVAYDGVNDRFLVAWADTLYEDPYLAEIWARLFDSAGRPAGSEIHITEGAGASRSGDQWEPAVAFNPAAQNYLVAWTDSISGASDDIYGRLVSTDGSLPGEVFPISTAAADQGSVALACGNDPPRFLALWQDARNAATGSDIRGAWFHEDGSQTLAEFVVLAAARDQARPVVAGAGKVLLAAWETAVDAPPPDFDVDWQPIDLPPTGTVTITVDGVNEVEATRSTAVKLLLAADSDVVQMCVSNTATCSAWKAFASPKSWTLATGNGTKTVHVWFKDKGGNKSLMPASDTILLDTVPPVDGTLTIEPGKASTTFELAWTAAGDALSGLKEYWLVGGTAGAPVCTATPKLYTGMELHFTHEGLTLGKTYSYRLCAVDHAGNVSKGAVRSKKVLTEYDPPADGTVAIIGYQGADAITKTAAVTLQLAATDANPPLQMCISNTPTCGSWVSFASPKAWTLSSGSGEKTVNVWFRDKLGNANPAPYSDTIILDTTKPVDGALAIEPGALNTTFELAWTAASDTWSGVREYWLVAGTAGAPACTATPKLYTGPELHFTHEGLTLGKTYHYRLCAVDHVGNVSKGVVKSKKVLEEYDPPSGGSVVIHGDPNDDYTRTASVVLSLNAADEHVPLQMCISNTATCGSWVAYAASKSWKLTPGSGEKTVNVWFRDALGNASATPCADTIVLDTTKPVDGTLTIEPGAENTTFELSWDGFSDALSGLNDYLLVFGTSGYPASCGPTALDLGKETKFTHEGLALGKTYFYRLCVTDNVGNVSKGVTAAKKVLPEYDPPSDGSIVIRAKDPYTSGEDTYTAFAAVTLELNATDPSEPLWMCLSNTPSCTSWVSFAPTKTWTLSAGSGEKTVSAWFKDAYGNVTQRSSDTVVLDMVKPVNGKLVIAQGAVNTTFELSWSGFSDALSGLKDYRLLGKVGSYPGCGDEDYILRAIVGDLTTTFTHSGLTPGQTWYYRVCAMDNVGNYTTGATASRKVPQ